MKLKINKACDLSSISVLPPQSRRINAIPNGPQASQIRSQTSQQSFSQGLSSQHGMFSQFSQTSHDETMTNDQRFSSQERENSMRRTSCVPQINYSHEESQLALSRSSNHPMRKWNPAYLQDHKCQINEELERRIGTIETSLNKFAMILDSVQSDVVQINKGMKEVMVETGSIRQKLIVLDSSLQLMKKEQENVKLSLEDSMKSISEQLGREAYQDKLQQIFLVLSALPEQMEASLVKLQNELRMIYNREMQAMISRINVPNINLVSPSIDELRPKVSGHQTTTQRIPDPLKSPAGPPKVCRERALVKTVKMEAWNSVKAEVSTCPHKASHNGRRFKGVSTVQKEKQCRFDIESDEETDGGFSCLIDEKEKGFKNCIIDEAKDETEKILRRARRRKRKSDRTIIIV